MILLFCLPALNQTIAKLESRGQSLEDYNYENRDIAELILNEFGELKFEGISGTVAFNEDTGDRIAWTQLEQLQAGKYEVVAFYDQRTDNLTWIPPKYGQVPDKVIWENGKVPQDRTIIKVTLKMVNLWLYISMVVLVIIGCLFACMLVWFNFKYAHRR